MGGGVRGIGFAGAINSLENSGYKIRRAVGVSAGAIAAAAVIAGFSGQELKKELLSLDYNRFKKKDYVPIGLVRDYINLRTDLGVFSADEFENWFSSLLAKKGVKTFGDLGQDSDKKLKVTAANIVTKKLLVLPDDLKLFGIDYKKFSIATAVRMSMSIPLFYEPYKLVDNKGNTHLIVDGGIFCNYPIWLLDDGCQKLKVPVFGVKFIECQSHEPKKLAKVFKVTDYLKTVLAAAIDASGHGYSRVTRGDSERTINISVCVDNKTIASTDFNLNQQIASTLFNNGEKAAKEFLKNWDFKQWQETRMRNEK